MTAGIKLAQKYQKQPGAGKTAKEFAQFLAKCSDFLAEVDLLSKRVKAFTGKFEMPGFENY